jgi:hypothetical protein
LQTCSALLAQRREFSWAAGIQVARHVRSNLRLEHVCPWLPAPDLFVRSGKELSPFSESNTSKTNALFVSASAFGVFKSLKVEAQINNIK